MILYTPIDIEFDMPPEQDIIDWFHQHKIKDTDYWEFSENRHTWCYVALRQEPKSWYTYDAWLDWSKERKAIDNTSLVVHPGFEDAFPGLAKCVRELPFDQIGTSGFIMQMGEIPAHQDAKTDHDASEPRRYIIYVTDPKHNTFYLEHNGVKIYPDIDEKYRCFAFNNNDIQHGADPTDRTKILLSTVGVINDQKHNDLIARSVAKFHDKVIRA